MLIQQILVQVQKRLTYETKSLILVVNVVWLRLLDAEQIYS